MTDELSRRIGALTPERRALLEQHLLRKRASGAGVGEAIPRRRAGDPAPLSFPQLRLWFLDQWAPGDPSYNAAIALRLDGPLDPGRLRAGLTRVVERHESLRTVFRAGPDGTPQQVVLDDWSVPLPVVDLMDASDDAVRQHLRAESRRPFDLTRDVMLRATLFRLAPASAVLLIGEHHIAFDGWSDTILFAEVAEVYAALGAGRAPSLPDLPIQYADFALWQQRRLTGPLLDRLVAYWRETLSGAPPVLDLPMDRPRPPVQTFAGAHHRVTDSAGTAAAVAALARAEGATAYITLLAAFAATLHRWTGCADMCIGTPIAGRGRVELEPLIGFFSNTVALRVRLDGDPTFRELLRRVKATALGAYEHQELPFEKVVEALAPPRNPSHNPLFQVNFRVQTGPAPTLRLPGVRVTPVDVDVGFSRFDLALEVRLPAAAQAGAGLSGYLEYNAALFEPGTAATLAGRFRRLLRDALARPDTPVSALAFHPAPAGEAAGIRGARRARSGRDGGGTPGSAGNG
jgi:hypothetical protein